MINDFSIKRMQLFMVRDIRGGGGNSYTGHGIHVPARVMGQFAVFCPGYGSCFVNFALVMGHVL